MNNSLGSILSTRTNVPVSEYTAPQRWHSGLTTKGDQLGRTINYPTINLQPSILEPNIKEGVYATLVKVKGITYLGALFLGPRLVLNETRRVLEIHILDFNQNIYYAEVDFQLYHYIRPVEAIPSFDILKQRLIEDCMRVRDLFYSYETRATPPRRFT